MFLLIALGAVLQLTIAQEAVVQCQYAQRVCECPPSYQTCYFQLDIDNAVAFTSYQLVLDETQRLVRVQDTTNVAQFQFGSKGNLVRTFGLKSNCSTATEGFAALNCTEPITLNLNRNCNPNGLVTVNGLIPGPTLLVTVGQTLVIDVVNKMTSSITTVHWHGIPQRGTPWMDGVPGVTQCPITPGSTYRYIFKAIPAGTFWYHSHVVQQRVQGEYGALIVRELSSVWVAAKAALAAAVGIPDMSIADSPEVHTLLLSDFEGSGLINGRGLYKGQASSYSRLTTINVQQKIGGAMYYRFRLIGAQGGPMFRFSIEDHKMVVIGTDGFLTEAQIGVDFIFIHAGERYDFLLQPVSPLQAQTKKDYLILAEPIPASRYSNAQGVLRYGEGAPLSTEYASIVGSPSRNCTRESRCTALNCPFRAYNSSKNIVCIPVTQLRLLFDTPSGDLPTGPVTDEIFFNFAANGRWGKTPAVNGRNFVFPIGSLLTQPNTTQLKRCPLGAINCSGAGECVCMYTYNLNGANKPAQLVLSALDVRGMEHPIHMHGHSFQVLGIYYGQYSGEKLAQANTDITCGNTASCTAPRWSVGAPPVTISSKTIRKDTVVVPAGGYAIIRFLVNNPGWYLMHCHIESDLEEGMAVVFNELNFLQPPPPASLAQIKCGSPGLVTVQEVFGSPDQSVQSQEVAAVVDEQEPFGGPSQSIFDETAYEEEVSQEAFAGPDQSEFDKTVYEEEVSQEAFAGPDQSEFDKTVYKEEVSQEAFAGPDQSAFDENVYEEEVSQEAFAGSDQSAFDEAMITAATSSVKTASVSRKPVCRSRDSGNYYLVACLIPKP